MSTENDKAINDTIETIVRKHIHSGNVVKVIVQRSDEPDDLIIVNVIFEAKHNKLDATETSQLSRHIWKRLIEMGETGFPSLSFIAKSEAGKLAAA